MHPELGANVFDDALGKTRMRRGALSRWALRAPTSSWVDVTCQGPQVPEQYAAATRLSEDRVATKHAASLSARPPAPGAGHSTIQITFHLVRHAAARWNIDPKFEV